MADHTKANKISKILFIIYLIALFEIIIFKMEIPFSNMGYFRNINLIPFHESLVINGKIVLFELFMNMVIFVPVGIYLQMICAKWSPVKKIAVVLSISLICEILQFILAAGASDITDIINNTIGGITGLLIMSIIIRLFPGKASEKVYKFVNILAAIGTLLMVLLLLYIMI